MKVKDKIVNQLMEKSQHIRTEFLKEKFGDQDFETNFNFWTMNLVTSWRDDLTTETNEEIREYIKDFDKLYVKIKNEISNM